MKGVVQSVKGENGIGQREARDACHGWNLKHKDAKNRSYSIFRFPFSVTCPDYGDRI